MITEFEAQTKHWEDGTMPKYLIQGLFFQNTQWMGLGMGDNGEGVIATITSGMAYGMYAGILIPDPSNLFGHQYLGSMQDPFGMSELSEVTVFHDEITFVKQYIGRSDVINYRFTRIEDNGMWVGSYSGSAVGQGGANCFLTEAPETMFQPPKI